MLREVLPRPSSKAARLLWGVSSNGEQARADSLDWEHYPAERRIHLTVDDYGNLADEDEDGEEKEGGQDECIKGNAEVHEQGAAEEDGTEEQDKRTGKESAGEETMQLTPGLPGGGGSSPLVFTCCTGRCGVEP